MLKILVVLLWFSQNFASIDYMDFIINLWEKIVEHHRQMTGIIFVIAMIKYAFPFVFYILNKIQDIRHQKRMNENRRVATESMLNAGYSQKQVEEFFDSIRPPEVGKKSILKIILASIRKRFRK